MIMKLVLKSMCFLFLQKIANPGPIKFKEEIPEIDAEAKRLKAQGVNILIALGHSGYTMDKQIAKEVPDIDVVVGGHTNTFLSSDPEPPSKEAIDGQYPTLITQPGMKGKIVPVVQAYAYTKYLGQLKLTFDNNGDLINTEGKPILLSQSYPEGD